MAQEAEGVSRESYIVGVIMRLMSLAESKLAPPNPSDHHTAIHRLKEEIDRLTKEQTEAVRRACYLGMTPDEAKEYDSRREKILKLVEHLRQLESAI
jgi:hypothetical protein